VQFRSNLEAVLEAFPQIVWSAAPDGTVDYVSQRALDYTGLSYEHCLGVGLGGALHPDHREPMAHAWNAAVTSGESFQYEFLGRRAPDGGWRWCISHAVPARDANGRVTRWYGGIIDLHHRKEAEEARLRAERLVLQAAPAAVVTIDDTSTIQFVNPSVTRIFGYAREELIGRPLTVLMPDRLVSSHVAGMRRYLETGQRRVNWSGIELTAVRKNGEEFPVEAAFAEVIHQNTRSFTGFIRDVSERRRLSEVQVELAHLSRLAALGQFAASIAHEVRQPLTAIMIGAKTCLRLLADTPELKDVRDALADVVEAGRRASEVIRRNRELFQNRNVRKARLDTNEVVKEVGVLTRTRFQGGRVAFTTNLADLPEIDGDRVELQQMLLNLIANGIEAMEANDSAPRVLEVATTLVPDGMVKVSVSDTGVGLDGLDSERSSRCSTRRSPGAPALASRSAARSSKPMEVSCGRSEKGAAARRSVLQFRFTARRPRTSPAPASSQGEENW
jgi:PAS domain S-box-containing protein